MDTPTVKLAEMKAEIQLYIVSLPCPFGPDR